jgi:nucleoside-diphosphate-sugar epimerase
MRQVYVEGLTNVLKQLQDWPPHRFIHISSTSVYGQTDGDWVDETAPTLPLSESGRVVLEAEQVLRSHVPDGIILRLAGIYGPGRLLRSDALVNGKPLPGDPDRWLNLIHVDDAATAVLSADERAGASGIYNIADGEPVRRGEFFSFLAELLGTPPPRFGGERLNDPTNRRIANGLVLKDMGLRLKFPSYRQGLPASLGTEGKRQKSS